MMLKSGHLESPEGKEMPKLKKMVRRKGVREETIWTKISTLKRSITQRSKVNSNRKKTAVMSSTTMEKEATMMLAVLKVALMAATMTMQTTVN